MFSLDKIFNFIKPSLVLLELKKGYKKLKISCNEETIFGYCILYITEQGRV